MTVFRGALRIAIRQKFLIILYLAIFMALGIMITVSKDNSSTLGYEKESVTMAVIDRDKTELSCGIREILEASQNVVDIEDNEKKIREELYYSNIEYALIIPENFEKNYLEAIENDDTTDNLLLGTGRPSSNASYYIKNIVDNYLSGINLYIKADYSIEEAINNMKSIDTSKNNVSIIEGSMESSKLSVGFMILPYVLIALSCFIIGFIILEYQKPEIKKRLEISAVSSFRRSTQLMLSVFVIGIIIFAISLGLVNILNPGNVFNDSNIGYYLINLIMMILNSIAIAFFVASVSVNSNAVNGLANVLSLGMSFLCGVFVPVSLLSKSVVKISKIIPVYWYENNNNILGIHSKLSNSQISQITNGYVKQLTGALIIFAIAFAIQKIRSSCRSK